MDMNCPVRRTVASAEPGVFFANIGPPPPERPPPTGFHEVELNKTRWVIPKAYDRLRSLGEGAYGVHGNVLEMIDVFTPDPDVTTLNNVYFVSVLMGSDLQNLLKIQRLKNEQIQALIYQVLRGLKYIHSAGIVHRDLKPSNIAVNEFGEVKLMCGLLAVSWLSWSLVNLCFQAMIVSSARIFQLRNIDQLTRIMGVVGTPSYYFLSKIQSEEARNYIRCV
uniref:Protein kinase domain-containing protein n=1 Tax=Angiostrongylus cantonensis TaxID=6313 RepID=A0A0K0D9V1_ANGCA